MSLDDRQTEPLSDAARALLEAEQARPGPAPQFGEAVWNRLALTLGLEPTMQAPPSAPDLLAPAAPVAAAAGWLSKILVGGLIAALGAAAGGGAVYVWMDGRADRARRTDTVERSAPDVAHGRAARLSEDADSLDRPQTVRSELQPEVGEDLPAREGALPVLPESGARAPVLGPGPGEETAQRSRPTPSVNEPPEPKAAPWAVAKSISAEEPAMLQRARTALARGEAREALALLDDHEQRFPAGQLVESREALRIQALMAVGETARARELVVEFRRRFPRSVFLSEVHRAVAGP